MPITPSSKAARHWSSVRSSNVPMLPGPTALMSALSLPSQRWLSSSNTLCTSSASVVSAAKPTASGLPRSVRSLAARSRTSFVRPTSATRAPSSARHFAAAKPIPRPPPTTTAVASFSPRSMAPSALCARPVRRALFRKGDGAFLGVVGGEDRNDQLELLLPHLVFAPVRRLDEDLLGGRHRQRSVGGDALGQLDRTCECFTGFGHFVDEAPCLALLGGKAVTGQRKLEGLLIRDSFLQPQQAAARRECLQVHAGAEVASGTGDHRHRQVGAVVQLVNRIRKTLADSQVHRISR